MQDVTIAVESPRQDDVIALIRALDSFHEGLYPPEANHHIDIEALCLPEITFLVARQGRKIMAIGALWQHAGETFGEVKRMFVREEARGLGFGAKMLSSIEDLARAARLSRLVLETGTLNDGALKLYERAGFTRRGPFAGYLDHRMSVFMEKTLSA